MAQIRRKAVVVGDPGVGKTSLLMYHTRNNYPQNYIPTYLEPSVKVLDIDGKIVELSLWDTEGSEGMDRLRPLSYPDSDVILICFAIDSPVSLANAREKWIMEVLHYCQGLPIILVGCKKDLREVTYDGKDCDEKTLYEESLDEKTLCETMLDLVSLGEGEKVRKSMGARIYIECSSKTGEGIKELFERAARLTLLGRRTTCRKRGCSIL